MRLDQRTGAALREAAVIVNPTRLPRQSRALRRTLTALGATNIVESTSKSHFIESVTAACEGEGRHIIVWGGDGTAHDAINAMVRAQERGSGLRKSLGFLRGGSGNGTQDSYGVPRSLRRQLESYGESISSNYVVDVDLLAVKSGSGVRYGQLAGFGFDAAVLARRERLRNKVTGRVPPGIIRYVSAAFRTFMATNFSHLPEYRILLADGKYAFRGPRVNAEFTFDRLERELAPVMIEVGTRPYYGKMFKVCPDVVCNDGNLDVYVYNFESRGDVVRNVLWVWTGKHHRINRRHVRKGIELIERYEIKRIEVSRSRPFSYHIDGELFEAEADETGVYRVSLAVMPSMLRFLVPGDFYRLFHPFD